MQIYFATHNVLVKFKFQIITWILYRKVRTNIDNTAKHRADISSKETVYLRVVSIKNVLNWK